MQYVYVSESYANPGVVSLVLKISHDDLGSLPVAPGSMVMIDDLQQLLVKLRLRDQDTACASSDNMSDEESMSLIFDHTRAVQPKHEKYS